MQYCENEKKITSMFYLDFKIASVQFRHLSDKGKMLDVYVLERYVKGLKCELLQP